MSTGFVPFAHRDDNLALELSATGDSFRQVRLTVIRYPSSQTFRLKFRIEDLRGLFRDAKRGDRAMAICEGPEPDLDTSYFLRVNHSPNHDRAYLNLSRMRKNVGRSRRTMHDTVFDHVGVGDFAQLYAKVMREPAPAQPPVTAPPPPPAQAAPNRAAELERLLLARDARILELEQMVKERDQMLAFYRQQQQG